jgi:ribosomal protein S18 acetylase RimI-like enzyme
VAAVSEPANDAPVVVRLGTAADAPDAARLHAGLIADGFLAHLGPRFLRPLYRCVAGGPDSFLLVAVDDAGVDRAPSGTPRPAIAGFLAGALDLRALYRRFALHHGVVAAVSSLPRLVGALPRAWETLRHGAGSPRADGRGADGGGAELLAIAVDPAWRGRHVGTLLVEGFLAELDRRAVGAAQVVVGADNAPAVALYESAGFRSERSFELHRGTTSLLMRRSR